MKYVLLIVAFLDPNDPTNNVQVVGERNLTIEECRTYLTLYAAQADDGLPYCIPEGRDMTIN